MGAVVVILTALVVFGVVARAPGLGGRWRARPDTHVVLRRKRAPWVLLGIVLVGVLVPWSFASFTWPLGLTLVYAVWRWRSGGADSRGRLILWMAGTAVIAAAIVSLGRQLDEPVQLLHARIHIKGSSEVVDGVFITATTDAVFVGDSTTGEIAGTPKDLIARLAVGPPDERAPSSSVLSRLIGGPRFAVRPLEVWCNGERYSWLQPHRICRTQPVLRWFDEDGSEPSRVLERLGAPVRIECPVVARTTCRGWLTLRSNDEFVFGRAGLERPVVLGPVRFAASPGNRTEACTEVSAGQRQQLETRTRRASGAAADFDAVLSHDADARTVFGRQRYRLRFGATEVRSLPSGSSVCEPRLKVTYSRPGPRRIRVMVRARAAGHGIQPPRVGGWVRLHGIQFPDVLGRRLDAEPLRRSAATLEARLPAGAWRLSVRYTSAAGFAYREDRGAVRKVTVRPARHPAARLCLLAAPTALGPGRASTWCLGPTLPVTSTLSGYRTSARSR